MALAGWARYLAITPAEQRAADASGAAAEYAKRAVNDSVVFLDLAAVFPAPLRESQRFRAAFVDAAERLAAVGPIAALGLIAALG